MALIPIPPADRPNLEIEGVKFDAARIITTVRGPHAVTVTLSTGITIRFDSQNQGQARLTEIETEIMAALYGEPYRAK